MQVAHPIRVRPRCPSERRRTGATAGSSGSFRFRPTRPTSPRRRPGGSAWVTQMRVGSTSLAATDEEESRRYAQSGRILHDHKTGGRRNARRRRHAAPRRLLPRCPAAGESGRRRLRGLDAAAGECRSGFGGSRARAAERDGAAALREAPASLPAPGRNQHGRLRRNRGGLRHQRSSPPDGCPAPRRSRSRAPVIGLPGTTCSARSSATTAISRRSVSGFPARSSRERGSTPAPTRT